jgi:hypothetical protein
VVQDTRLIDVRIRKAFGTLKANAITQADIMRLHYTMKGTPYGR